MKVKILKSGLFGFDPRTTKRLTEGEILDLSERHYKEIIGTSWAEDAVSICPAPKKPDTLVEPKEDQAEGVDWARVEEMADNKDKAALSDYAAQFGVELDKRKSATKMAQALKDAMQ